MEKGTINWGVMDLCGVVVTLSQEPLFTEVNSMEDLATQTAIHMSQAMVAEEAMDTIQAMVGVIQAAMAMSQAMAVEVTMSIIQGMVGVMERGTECSSKRDLWRSSMCKTVL